jgi:hypothetical protein
MNARRYQATKALSEPGMAILDFQDFLLPCREVVLVLHSSLQPKMIKDASHAQTLTPGTLSGFQTQRYGLCAFHRSR